MKFRETVSVIENREIGEKIFSLKLQTERIARNSEPGQFVCVYSNDASRLLPRPLSVCETDREGVLRLVFRVAGKGTEEFSALKAGDRVDLAGPLGKGFPLKKALGRDVILVGGGIGIPPMLQTAKALCMMSRKEWFEDHTDTYDTSVQKTDIIAILGYRDEQFLADDFAEYCKVMIATEDGSIGTRGNVLNVLREKNFYADVIFACGPLPMLRAIRDYASCVMAECYISVEEKMACGIGACLSCVCGSILIDEHSQVRNKRVCSEGPVFLSSDIDI